MVQINDDFDYAYIHKQLTVLAMIDPDSPIIKKTLELEEARN